MLNKFKSFFQGGFECAYPKIQGNKRIDLLAATQHDKKCKDDYIMIKKIGIHTVREGLSWSEIDKGNNIYEFKRFEEMMRIAKEENIQQIWDLNHFDFPDYIDPFSTKFVNQFEEYSKRANEVINKYDNNPYIVPINEISFFCWIGGEKGFWAPYQVNRGKEFKKQLVKASIKAMDAIWKNNSNVKFIQVDPIVRRIGKILNPTIKTIEKDFINDKFEAWDMLSGRISPDLGGSSKYLEICGVNYYFYNQQWIEELTSSEIDFPVMSWHSKERISLALMLNEVYQRYKKPILITETGSWGDMREKWWKRTLKEVEMAKEIKIPILGICSYPIIDRPDWVDGHLTNSGFWDFKEDDINLERIPQVPLLNIIENYIRTHNY